MFKRLGSAVGFALAFVTAAPAIAQNNKPVRTGTYYEDRASNIRDLFYVDLTFAQTPTDKFLNITKVMCYAVTYASSITLHQAQLFLGTTSGNSDTGRSFPLEFTFQDAAADGGRYYSFNPAVNIKVGAGRYPTIRLTTGSSNSSYRVSGDCTIIGDLSDN